MLLLLIVIICCIMFALEFFIQKLMKIAFGYHLREVIGSPRGLAICTDAGRGYDGRGRRSISRG